ncbi:MAG: phosphate propanoyltransferase [Erysipelotrichaceae bacterium]|jgi:putative phosphotransacetylase|nr:phosphate propanoyltransferase [Bacillota bacterium]MDY0118362.1 phosphate propanoyltransferase [Bacilli bacterium]NLJ32264.1 phosphate propanoyltransferase [Erysipelotrichaceae bacterium]
MEKKILVETSARHLHVTQEHLEILFGKSAKLEERAPLSQPGQYVSRQRVTIVGPKRSIERVSILGPTRKETQVEISLTDARTLGIEVPVRLSGDIKGSPGVKLVGPAGELTIEEGLIVAKRHIHMTNEDAKRFNVKHNDNVSVLVNTKDRKIVFGDVLIRVSDTFKLAMHIDTDESNAAGISGETFGTIVKNS